MGLIELASGRSVWRGLDYYQSKKVVSWEKSGGCCFDGIVSGSHGEKYTVHVDTEHPRKSTCSCAFAAGRRVVCKHAIALYFTAVPGTVERFLKQVKEWEEEEEELEEQHLADLRSYVNRLTKAELREQLFNALLELESRSDHYW